jgi:hypothetical protein
MTTCGKRGREGKERGRGERKEKSFYVAPYVVHVNKATF